MGLYMIEKPCAFIRDGKALAHRKIGVVVDLDDDLAASLGDAVRSLARPTEPTVTDGPTRTVLDGVIRSEPSLESNISGPILEPTKTQSNDDTLEPESETAERPKPRSRRKGSDGED